MVDGEREALRQRLLGWSLASPEIAPGTDLGRDLELVSGPNGVDFAKVEKLDALGQSLALGLTTALGSDVFNTEFGFDGLRALAEETLPLMAQERIRISIINLLRKEPRVRRIVDVKLGDGRLEQPVPGSRELSVTVVFETVTGDEAQATLGKVVLSG